MCPSGYIAEYYIVVKKGKVRLMGMINMLWDKN